MVCISFSLMAHLASPTLYLGDQLFNDIFIMQSCTFAVIQTLSTLPLRGMQLIGEPAI
jgi:hypothetical protein